MTTALASTRLRMQIMDLTALLHYSGRCSDLLGGQAARTAVDAGGKEGLNK